MSQITNKPHRIIVVSSTRAMSGIQTHNVGGDCSCSCKPKPPYDHDHDSPCEGVSYKEYMCNRIPDILYKLPMLLSHFV